MDATQNNICPVGSEPHLAATYTPIGTEEKLGELPIYTVGSGEKAIIFCYDIYGFNAGRTRLMCDQFAAAGFLVILPDFFRGDSKANYEGVAGPPEFVKKVTWDKVNADLTEQVYPYLERKGAKSIGIIGCCWGGYVQFKASASGKINAGVGFHPSLLRKAETPEELAQGVTCPQLILPGGNDPEEVKEGGIVEKVLKEKFGDKARVKTFTDMKHGWVPRGDLSDPNVARDVKEAMELAIEFFKANL